MVAVKNLPRLDCCIPPLLSPFSQCTLVVCMSSWSSFSRAAALRVKVMLSVSVCVSTYSVRCKLLMRVLSRAHLPLRFDHRSFTRLS